MSWKTLISRETESTYTITGKLFDLVSDDELTWKPASGENWMTVGQLLMHLSDACGAGMRGFFTGDWGLPEGMDMKEMSDQDMLPPADKLPSVKSVNQARNLLAADENLAKEMIGKVSESDLTTQPAPALWDPTEMILGHRLLQMVDHLRQHKGQLFYYLKLMGKPVNTMHLYGI